MEDESESNKRKRRDKYVRKACAECKRRKIKCDGELPCLHCQTVSAPCEYFEGKARGGARRAGQSVESADEYNEDVLARLQAVEDRLDLFAKQYPLKRGSVSGRSTRGDTPTSLPNTFFRPPVGQGLANEGTAAWSPGRAVSSPSSTKFRVPAMAEPSANSTNLGMHPPSSTSVFYGQSSSAGNLSNLRSQLNSFAGPKGLKQQEQTSSTPVSTQDQSVRDGARKDGAMLPGKSESFSILHIMFDDLISMYPLLHPPTFYSRYESLWDTKGVFRIDVANGDTFTAGEIGLLYACMAASGRTLDYSQQSPQCKDDITGATHRWYLAAKTLLVDQGLDSIADLESIQAMVMLSLYYLHVENEDAAYKIVGLAIRSAYEIGLHLASRERDLSGAQIEFRRRTWWCLYLVDRRTSMQLGRPFCIQDHDSDVQYPTPLDDLHEFPMQLEASIRLEQSKIPYLMQFVSFSSICGEIYSKVYGVKCRWPPDEQVVMELDGKLEQWRFALPAFLRFDQVNLNTIPTWLGKQQLFLHLRGAHVRLLLLRPFVSEPEAMAKSHHTMAESALRLSSDIIHTISIVKRTSDLVERLWYPSKQIILTCLGIIFWVVLNYPTKFSASSSKVDLRVALQLLKDFSEKSSNPRSRATLRDVQFLRYLCNQALQARNQVPIESAAQSPFHEPSYYAPTAATATGAGGHGNGNGNGNGAGGVAGQLSFDNGVNDLSFLGMPEMTQDDLLLNLLDTGDAGLLPSSEQFLMMGEDYSRQTMLSL